MRIEPYLLEVVPDRFETQDMCNEAVHREPSTLWYVPDPFKTQEMCDEAVKASGPCWLYGVPDWFVTQQQLKLWHDHAYYCNDDSLIKWYKDHKKRKTEKAKIKEELLPIACIDQDIGIGVCRKTRRSGGSNK